MGRLLGRRCGGEDDDQGRAIHVEHAYHRPRNGTIKVIEVGEKRSIQVDMAVDQGDTKGQAFKAIFRPRR